MSQEIICQQHRCSHGWMFPKMSAISVCAPAWVAASPSLPRRFSKTKKLLSMIFTLSQYAWDFMCAILEWNLFFLQSCGAPATKPHCYSKPNALGAHVTGVRPQTVKLYVEPRTLIPVGETLQYNYSPVCGLHFGFCYFSYRSNSIVSHFSFSECI